MENVMTYGMESKLRLPSCFVEVTDDEMEYFGEGWVSKIFGTVCAAIGGVVGIASGICALLIPEPGLTKVAGWCGIVAGVASLGSIAAIWED